MFALIEQPTYGWSDPLVCVPLIGGLALLARSCGTSAAPTTRCCRSASSARATSRSATSATLLIYGGLGAATFFVTIFLQQVAGYSAIAAGLSLVPITLVHVALSRRFGALSDRIGPRLLMGVGPIVAGSG